MKRIIRIATIAYVLFCFINFAKATSVDGTTSIQYLTTNHIFGNVSNYDEYATGYVKFNAGATILGSASATFDIIDPFSGGLDLRGTGTLSLSGSLYLDTNFTLSGSGVIRGNGNTIFLNGNLTIPANSVVHINSNTIIDGQGKDLIFGTRSRLFVDTNVTLTLQNMRIVQTYNDYSDPCIRLAAFQSQLALSNVEFALSQNFLFPQGQLFIHGDVAVTGTSAFIYQSTQHSFITPDSTFYFDIGTTFSVTPATFTDCKFDQWPTYTSNGFILMSDATSNLYFNQASLYATPTGCRLASGTVNFENQCTVNSNTALALPQAYLANTGLNVKTGSLPAGVAYSPDGNYFAVVNQQSNTLQIFNSVTPFAQIGSNVTTGSAPVSVSWANINSLTSTSTQLAVANSVANTVQVFNFNGSSTPTLSVSKSTGSSPSCVAWSLWGNYIAVTNAGSNTLQVFSASTLSPIGSSATTGNLPSSVSWAPGDQFLAVTNSGSNSLQVFSFNGSSTPTQIAIQTTGNTPSSVSWAQNGLFLSVANLNSNTLQIFSFDAGYTLNLIDTIPTDYGPISTAWSLDGSYLGVVNSSSGTLQFLQFINQSIAVQVGNNVTVGANPNSLSWSPNGSYIAVVNENDNTLQVFSFNGHSTPTQVDGLATTGFSPISVSWSSDGSHIAVVNNTSNTLQVFTFTGSGFSTTYTTTAVLSSPNSVSWSPNGSHIAVVSSGSSKLQVFSFAGGTPVQVSIPGTGSQPYSVSWSPAGSYIAVVNNGSNSLQVFPFNGSKISGSPFSTSIGLSSPKSVSWSPAGNYIVVVNGSNTLKVFPFNGFSIGSPYSVGTGTGPNSVSWSQDGRFIVVVNSQSGTLQVFSFNGSDAPTQVGGNTSLGLSPLTYNASCASWSPAGKFIAVVSNNTTFNPSPPPFFFPGKLQVFSFNASAYTSPVIGDSFIQNTPSSMSWNPNYEYIAVAESNSNEVELLGLQHPNVVDSVDGSVGTDAGPYSVSWSPDGRFLGVVTILDLQVFSFNGSSSPTMIGRGPTVNYLYTGLWSPDGKFIAAVNSQQNELLVYSVNGGTPAQVGIVDAGYYPYSASWSPDGSYIAVINYYGSTLQIFSFTGVSPTQVTTGSGVATGNQPNFVTWSADGKFLAVVNYVDNTLQVFSFNVPSNPTQVAITGTGTYPSSVSWSPDDRFIAVVNYLSNTLQVFSFNGSSTLIQIGGNVATGLQPQSVTWSPNGRFIAVVNNGANTLQVFVFDGSDTPTQVGIDISTNGLGAYSASWSLDGKFIAVVNETSQGLQVFKVNYVPDISVQAISNGVVFGNSSMGAAYDATVNVLAGANIDVDGLINYDCVV